MSEPISEPTPANDFLCAQVALLLDSHRRLTGRELLPLGSAGDSPAAAARALYHAPCVVLAHDRAADPLFTYANLAAQQRFALPWSQLVGMPSRYSAEPLARDARQRLLDAVSRQGYIDDYRGVRIASDGRRFEVVDATVWNLLDAAGRVHGQAASFARWLELG